MLIVHHAVPRDDVMLGILRGERIFMDRYPSEFEPRLDAAIAERAGGLGDSEEVRRAAARDILRNGSYKPTGRGKPASEYLLRAASGSEGSFPRINGPVDVCNYLSLKHVVPISLWDLDRAGTRRYVFRLGRPGEGFVFNAGGQRIAVEDLLVGCRVREEKDSLGEPIVNPVRDSLETKTTHETRRIAACLYAPSDAFSRSSLESVCREFADLLAQCGDETEVAFGIAGPNSSVEV